MDGYVAREGDEEAAERRGFKGWIILKSASKEMCCDLWTGARWSRIGSSGRALVSKVINSAVP
jgi:hypothetical protein